MTRPDSRIKELYEAYAGPIYRFLYWHTSDPLLAEDLTSEVFVRAWKHRNQLEGDLARAWLYRVARNLITDHYRRKHDVALDESYDPISTYDLHEEAQRNESSSLLRQALRTMPVEQRTIIILRFFEHLPAAEVALIMKKSAGNVRVLQYRALKDLRKRLER